MFYKQAFINKVVIGLTSNLKIIESELKGLFFKTRNNEFVFFPQDICVSF